MSTTYKYEEEFAVKLATRWFNGEREEVRAVIRNLKNKAEASYIAAAITDHLESDTREIFVNFIHPNNK